MITIVSLIFSSSFTLILFVMGRQRIRLNSGKHLDVSLRNTLHIFDV